MGKLRLIHVWFIYFLLILLLHLPFLKLPPVAAHLWRQCNTLAMSKNFAEEGMDITKPKIDRRNETNGVTGSHFPLYEWGLACLSKIFTYNETVARLYSAFIFSLAMLALFQMVISLGIKKKLAFCSGLLLLSIPQFYYDSINAMPDLLALSLALFAWLFLYTGIHSNSIIKIILGSLLCALAGMVKIQFLIIPFSALVFTRFNKKYFFLSVLPLLSLWPVFKWYTYAQELTTVNNLKEYGLWIKPIPLSEKWNTLFGNILSDFPEMLIGWPLLLGLIYLTALKLKTIRFNRFHWMLLVWVIAFTVFYIVAIERMKHHSYYFMVLLPLFVLVFTALVKDMKAGFKLMLLVVCLNFIWSGVRIIPSRWIPSKYGLPSEFLDKDSRAALKASVPVGEKVLIGPDISGCIYFYFTNTKGYSFENYEEFVNQKDGKLKLLEMRKQGIRYAIIQNGNLKSEMLELLGNKSKITSVGTFEVWKLNP